MQVKATYKYARISAKKARDVARAVQGLPVSSALDILSYTPKKAAFLIGKTLKSAIANAENNHDLDAESLVIHEAIIGTGPSFRRSKPRARGSASPIKKRTSHIFITLTDEVKEPAEQTSKATPKKKAAPTKSAPKKKAAVSSTDSAGASSEIDAKRGQIFNSRPTEVDDLKVIKGVGPGLEEKLNDFGIYQYQQISNWTEDNVEEFDDLLSFKGRIQRDDWLAQAQKLHQEKSKA